MPDSNNKGGNHEFCGQCTACKIILSHQNKQHTDMLSNCCKAKILTPTMNGLPYWNCSVCGKAVIIESPCTKSNYEEEKCYSCGGKGTYSQIHGVHGAEDFGGDGFDIKPSIHIYPCKACNGTGLKPKSNYEGEEKCELGSKDCKGEYFHNHTVSLSPQENDIRQQIEELCVKENIWWIDGEDKWNVGNNYDFINALISLLALQEKKAYERGVDDFKNIIDKLLAKMSLSPEEEK